MIMAESKDLHELARVAGILTTSAQKDDIQDLNLLQPIWLGSFTYNKGYNWDTIPLVKRVVKRPHLPVRRAALVTDSESEEEHELIKLSSIDPPMPSKSVKEWNRKRKRNKEQAQPVKYGENLVGKRIKVWWGVDNRYYEGVVESFDCSKMKHKVSYDDGDEEILKLEGERWELVENVSPISHSVKKVALTIDSESEGEHEKIKPSSIDPPMPSRSVTEGSGKRKRNIEQAQPVKHGENLVGKRIKIWWGVGEDRYYEAVVESFDSSKNQHKVSYDDGEQAPLNLKYKRWELVENVSPTSDCVNISLPVGVAVPEKVSSSQSDMICVQGYMVKNINAPILKAIFRSHGDIAAKCVFTNAAVRTPLLEAVCEIVWRIKANDVSNIISEMEEIDSQVSAAEASKINVSWLQAHLETMRKRYKAQQKVTLLMEMKTNTMLAMKAASTGLKDKHDNLVAAIYQYKEAKRCVKVLGLVKKKLSNDILESKAEKDLFAEQPIIDVD